MSFKVKVFSQDDTKHYNIAPEHKPWVERIESVYAYRPDQAMHCCELTPSYECWYLYTSVVSPMDVSEAMRNELDETYCYQDSEDIYIHCAVLDRRTDSVEQGPFETEEEAREYLQGNHVL